MASGQLLNRSAIANALNVSSGHGVLNKAWAQIQEQLNQGENQGEITISGEKVPWRLSGNGRKVPLIPEDALHSFRRELDSGEYAGSDYLSRQAIAETLGVIASHRILATVWSAMRGQMEEGKDKGEVEFNGKTIPWRVMLSSKRVRLPFVAASSLSVFKAAFQAVPPKATEEELSFRRLLEELNVPPSNIVLVYLKTKIEAEIEAGKTSGEIVVAGEAIPWEMKQAIWGGSSKWGNVSPHIPRTAVPTIKAAIDVRLEPRDAVIASNDRALSSWTKHREEKPEVEPPANLSDDQEIEVSLLLERKPGFTDKLTVKCFMSAHGNLLFHLHNAPHAVTPEGNVFRRVGSGPNGRWVHSSGIKVDPDFSLETQRYYPARY